MAGTPENPQEFYKSRGLHEGLTPEQWLEVEEWWQNLVPDFKDWTTNQTEQAADYLRANNVDAIGHIRSKFAETTRLAVVGMYFPPNFDNLPFQIVEQIPEVDFIAVDVRHPDDETSFEEAKPLMTTVDLGDGMKVDMPYEEARRRYPDQFINAGQRPNPYEDVINAAQERGITVLYTERGSNWKEMHTLAAQEISDYMREHTEEKGVYFSSVYAALKWPGYQTKEEEEQLEFTRPLSTEAHFLSQDPKNDNSVRMPAYELEQQFPGQVYSTAQFAMPRGFGQEWKNLRSAVVASRIEQRFATDIQNSPFAVQRYLFRGAVELHEVPDEELYKYFGTMAQGFFAPIEVLWEKVLDGVIVYPSKDPLPTPLTKEQMLERAGQYIAETMQDQQ